MWVYEKECLHAELDEKEVARVARNLSKWGKKAHELGLGVFGGSGSGTLRVFGTDALIVADIDGSFDGGDGATHEDKNGLHRGEFV